MATRDYWAVFGSGAPSTYSGLAPTFISFINGGGSNITSPAITEPGTKGLYKFAYDATQTISFVLDGATTQLASSDRYITGVLDAYDTFGVTLNAIGATQSANGILLGNMGITLSAIGSTVGLIGGIGSTQTANGILITNIGTTLVATGSSLSGLASFVGSTASSFGSTSIDPTTLFGFLKRAQEMTEGNETYVKSTGVMTASSRGSSTLLASKTISDTSSQTTKT